MAQIILAILLASATQPATLGVRRAEAACTLARGRFVPCL